MDYTLYILINPKLNKGQRIAQAAHAAVEITRTHHTPEGRCETFEKWLSDPRLICLAVDPREVTGLVNRCCREGYEVADFRDDDFDVTTWGIGPVPCGEARTIFAGYKLA